MHFTVMKCMEVISYTEVMKRYFFKYNHQIRNILKLIDEELGEKNRKE